MIINLGVLTRRVSKVIHGEVTRKRVSQLLAFNHLVASPQLRTFNHQTTLNRRSQEEPHEDLCEDYQTEAVPDMPPKGKKRQVEKYKSDDGFVEDAASSTKRSKVEIGKKGIDDGGNPYWEIGGRLRRVGVSKFKGRDLINIREYFEKDGELLPGKKGISLTVEQFNAFLSALPQIEQHLTDAGVVIERPNFGGSAAIEQEDEAAAKEEEKQEEEQEQEQEQEEVEEEEEEEAPKPKANYKRGRK